jgi:hypothetical protein
MFKPHSKYRATLSNAERQSLLQLVKTGKTSGCRIRHAHILPALDEIPANEHWSDELIGAAYGCYQRTIGELRKRFVEEGFEDALERKQLQAPPPVKIDGEAAAKIIALGCSEPPPEQPLDAQGAGRRRGRTGYAGQWNRRPFKKTTYNPGRVRNGVSPKRLPTGLSGRKPYLRPIPCPPMRSDRWYVRTK